MALLLVAAVAVAAVDLSRFAGVRKDLAAAKVKEKDVASSIIEARDALARKDAVGKVIAPTLLACAKLLEGSDTKLAAELRATARAMADALDPGAAARLVDPVKAAKTRLEALERSNRKGYPKKTIDERRELDATLKKHWPAYRPLNDAMKLLMDGAKEHGGEAHKLLTRMAAAVDGSDKVAKPESTGG